MRISRVRKVWVQIYECGENKLSQSLSIFRFKKQKNKIKFEYFTECQRARRFPSQ